MTKSKQEWEKKLLHMYGYGEWFYTPVHKLIKELLKEERQRVIEMIEKEKADIRQQLITEFPPRFEAGGGLVGKPIIPRKHYLETRLLTISDLQSKLEEK